MPIRLPVSNFVYKMHRLFTWTSKLKLAVTQRHWKWYHSRCQKWHEIAPKLL